MTKYKEFVVKMLSEQKELFDEFRKVHDSYVLDMGTKQDEFNEVGKRVMKVVREYEGRLCNRSESNGYASFTGNLAQKFMDEIRKEFPQIDRVGIIVRKPTTPPFNLTNLSPNNSKQMFTLKKITLN